MKIILLNIQTNIFSLKAYLGDLVDSELALLSVKISC